jgi:hypothetical protein
VGLTAKALRAAALAGLASLALAACSGAGPAENGAATSGAPSGSTASPAGTAAGLVFAPVAGYAYASLTAEELPMVTSLTATALTADADGRDVTSDASGFVGSLLLAQYKAELVPRLDAKPLATLLDGAAQAESARAGSSAKVTTQLAAGTEYRLVSAPAVTIGIAYRTGGHLIEFVGIDDPSVIAFMTKYLSATA